MALLRIEGFDHQDTETDLVSELGAFCWRTSSGLAFSSYGSGIGGIGKSINISAGGYLTGTFTTPLAAGYIGMYLEMPSSPLVSRQFTIVLYNSGSSQNPLFSTTTGQVQIVFNNSNGSVSAYRGVLGGTDNALIFTSGNNVFANNTPFFFELFANINTLGSGNVTCNINGQQIINANATTSIDGNNIFDSILLGASYNFNPGVSPNIIDHMYMENTAVGPGAFPFNGFLGPAQVNTLFVTGNGSADQYTPAAGTNASQVEETAMDSDTTYNFNATVGDFDLFTIQSLPTNVTPVAVQVSSAAREDASGTRQVANLLNPAGTSFAGTSQALSTGYAYQHDVFPQNPGSSSAWTQSTVNACQIGYKTTN